MPKVSPQKRARIAALLSTGLSTRDIARREQVSQSTVARLRHVDYASRDYKDAPRSGRPRRLTDRHERSIVRVLASGECQTAVDVQSHLRAHANVSVSANTVRRVLRRRGFASRVKRKKPFLTEKHRRNRLAFAKKYKHWTVEDWKRVVWSDEAKFELFGSKRRQYCWVKPGAPLTSRQIQPTVKHGGGNIMVWGCFTAHGIGYLCRIVDGLDAELYQQILADELMQTLAFYHLDKADVVFQHDNDPKHTAKSTKVWLEANNIQVLSWPAQSPDLNPIEHLWDEAQRRLRERSSRATRVEGLWDALQDVWESIPVEECIKLIETMPQRIQDVLNAQGGHTRW
jgi:transposase